MLEFTVLQGLSINLMNSLSSLYVCVLISIFSSNGIYEQLLTSGE